MLVIILIVLQVMDTFLLFRLMKKGSFVTVQNKVIYVPARKGCSYKEATTRRG